MTQTLEISNTYPDQSAGKIWNLCKDFQALSKVCDGVVAFEGLPLGSCFEGQRLTVQVRLFGLFPAQTYHMHVVSLDDDLRILQSAEQGAGVKTWAHRIWVEDTGTGAILHDRVELDAGWLTPLFALYARFFYNHRHRRRLKLLADGVL